MLHIYTPLLVNQLLLFLHFVFFLILYKCSVFDYEYSVLSSFFFFFFFLPLLLSPPPHPIYVKVYYCFILLCPLPPPILPPTTRDLGPRQNRFADNPALNQFN